MSSSCNIASALSFATSRNTSVAILRLLEAVLQHLCSSTPFLQSGRGSTLVSLFLQKLLWRHNVTFLSRSFINISFFSLSSQSIVFDVLFTAVFTALRCVTKARLKASNLMSFWYELYILLCFDLCVLTYSCNQAVMLALNHGISRLLAYIFLATIGILKILHFASKRSKLYKKSSSSDCSLVGASCRLFSLTPAFSNLIAIITPTTTIAMGCDESGKPMESSSLET